MIDYEKLQEAHELLAESPENYAEILLGDMDGINIFMLYGRKKYGFKSLDDFMKKLQELTQPKPKYEVGQILWFVDYLNDKYGPSLELKNLPVVSIDFDPDTIRYFLSDDYGWTLKESELFPTKSALIQSKIDYWTCLKNEEISTQDKNISTQSTLKEADINNNQEGVGLSGCQHETDGSGYAKTLLGTICFPFKSPTLLPVDCLVQYKCIKCGDYYE